MERSDARFWADSDLEPLFEGAFPAFITADQEAKAYIGRVRDWFAGLGIIVTEDGQTPWPPAGRAARSSPPHRAQRR